MKIGMIAKENGECNQERDPPMLHGTTGIIVREVRIKKTSPMPWCACVLTCVGSKRR